jgi:hypothetical protein
MLSRSHEQSKRFIKVIVDLVALAAQATGFVVWPLLEGREKPELWLIPFTVILISCGWWENYVNIPKDSHSSELRLRDATGLQHKKLFPCHKQRAFFASLIPDGHFYVLEEMLFVPVASRLQRSSPVLWLIFLSL